MSPESDDHQWFVNIEGAQAGPFTLHEINEKLDAGEITVSNLAWRDGMTDWQPISRVPELGAAGETPPAASQPAAINTEANPANSGTAPAGRPRKRRGKSKFAAVALILLLIAAGAGAVYVYLEFFQEDEDVIFSELMPQDVRYYAESELGGYEGRRQQTFQEFYNYFRTLAKSPDALPEGPFPEFRMALGIYGAASLVGRLPSAVVIIEAADDESAARIDELLAQSEQITPQGEPREVDGWTVQDYAGGEIPMVGKLTFELAERGRLRVVTNNPEMLQKIFSNHKGGEDARPLSTDARFKAAISKLPAEVNAIAFLDLAGIVTDVHPFVSMLGGDIYTEIKKTWLDPLDYYIVSGRPEGEAIVSTADLYFTDGAAYFGDPSGIAIQWPVQRDGDNSISMAMSYPQIFRQEIPGIIERVAEWQSGMKGNVSQTRISAINSALATFYSSRNEYPVFKSAVPVEKTDLFPEFYSYGEDPPDGTILYQSNGDTYSLTATDPAGKPILFYDSSKGSYEDLAEADAAAQIEIAKSLISNIAEIGMTFKWQDDAPHGAVGVRFHEALDSEVIAMIDTAGEAATSKSPLPFTLVHHENWVAAGTKEKVDQVQKALAGGNSRNKFLEADFSIDLSEWLGDTFPTIQFEGTAQATVEENAYRSSGTVSPDPSPIQFAQFLMYLYGGGFDDLKKNPLMSPPPIPKAPESEQEAAVHSPPSDKLARR